MELTAVLRMLGSLGLVLGLLAGALWLVRRFDLRLPGAVGTGGARVQLVERVSLDPRRSVALLRRDGREHLILLAPEGHLVIESGILPDAADLLSRQQRDDEQRARRLAQEEAIAAAKDRFAQLVDRATARLRAAPAPTIPRAASPTRKPAKRARKRPARSLRSGKAA